jgi:hypothetical protein
MNSQWLSVERESLEKHSVCMAALILSEAAWENAMTQNSSRPPSRGICKREKCVKNA